MRIALDAMGGDYGTGPNLEGALAALKANPNLEVVLVGDPAELEQGLATLDIDRARVRVVASEGVAGMDEKPVEALMKKPNCSIAGAAPAAGIAPLAPGSPGGSGRPGGLPRKVPGGMPAGSPGRAPRGEIFGSPPVGNPS